MANTDKLSLPLIEPNMTADVPRDVNALAEAVDAKVGVAGGLAVLGADGKVPADQLNVKDPADASLTQKGIVQLTNATNSTSETLAPTAKALKTTYDLANSAYRARGNVPSDWNTAILSGNYAVALANWTGYSNYPAGSYTYGKLVVHGDYGLRVQTYHTHDNPGRVYTRVSFNDTDWRAWTEVITSNTTANWQKYRLTTDTGSNILYISGDLNNLTKNGFYAGENLGNCPLGKALGTWAYIEVMSLDGTSGYVIQKLYNLHGDFSFYVRTQKSGTWGPWSQDLFTSVVDGKGAVAGVINGKGGTASASNSFAELATAITNLPVKRFASGTFNGQSAQATSNTVGVGMTVAVALPFTVNRVFIRVVLAETDGTRHVDAIVMSSSVFNDNISAKGWRNNYVNVGYLEPPIQGFSVKLSGSRIDAYAGGSPVAKISAYEWWAYE
ncbi:pyocin knob domain-containing protein [Paenibacillus sp. NRS-1782]|uniref:pyocin knob domain-containing protein n=1 Tax=unclassified Paenibacillus TaxID=185978 RepID=UPI003D29A226